MEEDASEIVHDPADIDDAGASGSARELNLIASELGLHQYLETDLPELNFVAFFRIEDATDLVGRFECTGYDRSDCSGLVLGQDSAETPLAENPEVWGGLETDLTVPTAASVFCGVALETPGGLPFEAVLDDLRAQETAFFIEGFESGDTSAWPAAVP